MTSPHGSSHIAAGKKSRWQDVSQLEKDATQFAQQQLIQSHPDDRIQISGMSLDRNLRLKTCDKPLTFAMHGQRHGASNVTVKASCEGSWSFYINGDVDHWRPLLVASRALGRDHKIGAEDLEIRELKMSSQYRGTLQNPTSAIGMVVRRPLHSGEPLRPGDLTAPKLVNRGDQLQVVARSGSIAVSTTGTALADGKLGQQIAIRNIRSERIVKATVVGPAQVEIAL